LLLRRLFSRTNAEKMKLMVTSQDLHVGQYHNIKRGNKSFETVEQFKYLGSTHTNLIPFMKKLRAD
jgi:hypothetical protein